MQVFPIMNVVIFRVCEKSMLPPVLITKRIPFPWYTLFQANSNCFYQIFWEIVWITDDLEQHGLQTIPEVESWNTY